MLFSNPVFRVIKHFTEPAQRFLFGILHAENDTSFQTTIFYSSCLFHKFGMGTVLPTQNIYFLYIHTKEILASSANCLHSLKNFLNKEFLFKEIKEMKHKPHKLLSLWEEKVNDDWKCESTVFIKTVFFFFSPLSSPRKRAGSNRNHQLTQLRAAPVFPSQDSYPFIGIEYTFSMAFFFLIGV